MGNNPGTAGNKPIYEMAAAPAPATADALLTDAQLAPIAAEAKALWTQALGAGDSRLAALGSVQIVVGNLPQGGLGVTIGNLILIDADAAGYGWFADGSLQAQIPSGQMDLLTVVAHELGNAMGIPEDAQATDRVR